MKHGELLKACCCYCCDVTTLKMTRKPVKLQEENPAGCGGEGNYEKRKG